MTEMQRQFEEWAKSVSHNMVPGGNLDRSYLSYETQIAYEAWVASRAAVVVKLPSELEVYNDRSGYVLEIVRDSLGKAGVSYE